jgi:hypothetical protein
MVVGRTAGVRAEDTGGIAEAFPDPSLYPPAQAKPGRGTPVGEKCMSRVSGAGQRPFVRLSLRVERYALLNRDG